MKEFHERASNGDLVEPRMKEKKVAILAVVPTTMRGVSPPHELLKIAKYGHGLETLVAPKLDKISHDYGNFGCIKIAIIFSLTLGVEFCQP